MITQSYLQHHPEEIFVFGDNLKRKGYGGAAVLRDCWNTYGFITKKYPTTGVDAYYKLEEYVSVFEIELYKLKLQIEKNPDKVYLISKLGAGLANRFHIFEMIIEPGIKQQLNEYSNVKFLW